MSRNLKIEKINAYKKMLETKRLPKIGETESKARNPDDPSTFSIEEQIHMEFEAWAEAQLADLLGEDSPKKTNTVFTEEQEDVLRQFADKMIAKASGTNAPVPAPKQAERTSTTTGGYKPNPNAQPLGNRLRDRTQSKGGKPSARDTYLAELERLDRETPDFD